MVRFILSLIVIFAFACGGDTESVSDAAEGAANDVAARGADAADAAHDMAGDAADAAGAAMDDAADTDASAMNNPAATSCLGLVGDAKFTEAVPVCTEALGVDPANVDVQQALDRAKAEAAKAAMDSATDNATKGAADAAGKLLN